MYNSHVFILGAICSENMFSYGNDNCTSPSLVNNGQVDSDDKSDEETGSTGIENGRYW